MGGRRRRKRGDVGSFPAVLCNDNDIIQMNNAAPPPPPTFVSLPMIPAVATRERRRPPLLLPLIARPLKPELPSASTDDVEGISLLGSSDHSWNTDWAPVSACPCSLRSDNIDIRFLLLLFPPPVSSFQTRSGPGALIASSAALLSPPMSAEGSNESCVSPTGTFFPAHGGPFLLSLSLKPGPSLFPWSWTMVAGGAATPQDGGVHSCPVVPQVSSDQL